MKSGDLVIKGSSFKCFFFEVRSRKRRKVQPFVLKKFFVLPPCSNATREEAYLYLAHALLVAQCYDVNQLHKLHEKEFHYPLAVEQFSKRHKKIFDVWESMRPDRSIPILFTDEEHMRLTVFSLFPGCSMSFSSESKFSMDSSFQKRNEAISPDGSKKSENDIFIEENESNVCRSENPPFVSLKSSMGEVSCVSEVAMRKELEIRDNEIQQQKDLILSLKKQLDHAKITNERAKKTNLYYDIVRENENAVAAIEKNFKDREKELQEMFQTAMQERDICIARLSASQVKLLDQQKDYLVRIKELEKLLEDSKNQNVRSVEQAVSSASSLQEKEFLLRHLAEVQRQYALISEECNRKEKREAELVDALSASKNRILLQEKELHRAYFLMTTLQDGINTINQFLPHC